MAPTRLLGCVSQKAVVQIKAVLVVFGITGSDNHRFNNSAAAFLQVTDFLPTSSFRGIAR